LTATIAELYYTLYNELLELNPEKPKEVKEAQRIIYLSNSLLELNPEKIKKWR
jgi:hypothetical protein